MLLLLFAERCRVVVQKEYIAEVETDDIEERSDLWLLSLFLNVLLRVVWCHNSLHLMFTFQAPIQEMFDLKEMSD